jgi:hypothetical protein
VDKGETEMKLTVYGSFNFLAQLRVERLSSLGVADVEWRTAVHNPDVPSGGLPVVGELAGMFDRELDEIRGLLRVDESYPARRPMVPPKPPAKKDDDICPIMDGRSFAAFVTTLGRPDGHP